MNSNNKFNLSKRELYDLPFWKFNELLDELIDKDDEYSRRKVIQYFYISFGKITKYKKSIFSSANDIYIFYMFSYLKFDSKRRFNYYFKLYLKEAIKFNKDKSNLYALYMMYNLLSEKELLIYYKKYKVLFDIKHKHKKYKIANAIFNSRGRHLHKLFYLFNSDSLSNSEWLTIIFKTDNFHGIQKELTEIYLEKIKNNTKKKKGVVLLDIPDSFYRTVFFKMNSLRIFSVLKKNKVFDNRVNVVNYLTQMTQTVRFIYDDIKEVRKVMSTLLLSEHIINDKPFIDSLLLQIKNTKGMYSHSSQRGSYYLSLSDDSRDRLKNTYLYYQNFVRKVKIKNIVKEK